MNQIVHASRHIPPIRLTIAEIWVRLGTKDVTSSSHVRAHVGSACSLTVLIVRPSERETSVPRNSTNESQTHSGPMEPRTEGTIPRTPL